MDGLGDAMTTTGNLQVINNKSPFPTIYIKVFKICAFRGFKVLQVFYDDGIGGVFNRFSGRFVNSPTPL